MKLKKAIEILTGCMEANSFIRGSDLHSSVQLGIEALKRCQYISKHTDRWAGVLLPGETKE